MQRPAHFRQAGLMVGVLALKMLGPQEQPLSPQNLR